MFDAAVVFSEMVLRDSLVCKYIYVSLNVISQCIVTKLTANPVVFCTIDLYY